MFIELLISLILIEKTQKINLKKYAMKPGNFFYQYFGLPGSGKTTTGAKWAQKYLKENKKVFSNVPIKGTLKIEPLEDLGTYLIRDGLLIIDEAGLEYNNRDFKTFSKKALKFYKKHRHYNIDIVLFSQAVDIDKKLRDLTSTIFLTKKFTPFFVLVIPYKKKIGINDLTKEIQEEFFCNIFGIRLYRPYKYWYMFSTHDPEKLPSKEFEVYQ